MDNSTFEAMGTEGTEVEKIDQSLEKYRFLFIRYLDVLADLLELYSNFVAVDRVKMVLEHGWRRDNPEIVEIQEQAAIQAEKFLYERYDLDCSVVGCQNAVNQFFADCDVLATLESDLWCRLVDYVETIEFADEDSDDAWFSGDIDKQHQLLSVDELSSERMLHYKKELQQMSKKPMSPNLLEMMFRFRRKNLMLVTPFPL